MVPVVKCLAFDEHQTPSFPLLSCLLKQDIRLIIRSSSDHKGVLSLQRDKAAVHYLLEI